MSEDKTAIILFTRDFRIEGKIDLIPGARITDFMNNANMFIVVTEAKVSDHDGNEKISGHFINVLKESIQVIVPADAVL